MSSDRDLGQPSFQAFIELEQMHFNQNSAQNPISRSATDAIEESTSRYWLFEATQRRKDQHMSTENSAEHRPNTRLAQNFESVPEISPESKLKLLQEDLDRINELTLNQLQALRRDIAKLLHPDKIGISGTADATSKLAEINSAIDTAISRILANSKRTKTLPHPKHSLRTQ